MRKALAAIVATVAGLAILIDFFVEHPIVDAVGGILIDGALIIAGCALLLGLLNLLAVHGRRVQEREGDPMPSLALLLSLLVTLLLGLASGPGSTSFRWMFQYVYYPIQATIGSLLAFFVVTAAYRAFRLHTLEAVVLTVVSGIVLLAQIPGSEKLWAYLPPLREWVFSVPVTAGMRGIIMGTALGTITTGLRLLFWVDQPYA